MTNNTSTTTDIPLLTAPFLQYIPSNEYDFQSPSRTPHYGLTVAEWAGKKTKQHKEIKVCKAKTDNWKDVYRNIKCMDQLYDASFYSWLKAEENVMVTVVYLHRIANEYPLERIVNAFKWLISDWRLESISTLVRYVTVDWCDQVGDLRRAHLLRHLTQSWATQYTTTLITMVLSSAPYSSATHVERERFLRAFTQGWDFSKLSEFFMYLQSPANIDYKLKCIMLQEAARKEREELGAKLCKKKEENERRHHRRTSSNDVNDIKRLRLSTPDVDSQSDVSHTCNSNCSHPLHSRSLTSSSPTNPPSNSGNVGNTNSGDNNGNTNDNGNSCGSNPGNIGTSTNNNDSDGSSGSSSGSSSTCEDNRQLIHSLASSSSAQEAANERDVFLSLQGFPHLRRSSSVGSTDSNEMIEDPMDTATETTMKKKEWDRVF